MLNKQVFLMALITLMLVFTIGCRNNTEGNGGLQGMKFGKNISITVSDNEVVDANYLQKVLDGEVKKEVPYFDLLDDKELKSLIDYMEQNNFIIVPGQYAFNQAWAFDNGVFVLNNGEKREVLKFKTKDN